MVVHYDKIKPQHLGKELLSGRPLLKSAGRRIIFAIVAENSI